MENAADAYYLKLMVSSLYISICRCNRRLENSGQTFNQITNTPEYIAATGGTITCCGDYKIHTFTGPGTFTVTNAGNPLGSTTVDYLVVAGGGGGGGGGTFMAVVVEQEDLENQLVAA
jgi:hypothetical protein